MSTSIALRKPSTSAGTGPSTSSSSTPNTTDADPRHASPSRLPVNKPHTRSVSVAAASNGTARALNGTRAAPTGLGAASRQQQQTDGPLKKESARYPPSTTKTRPAGVARPTSSDGARTAAPRRVPTHTRAKSTATPSTLNPPTVLRPPSQGSSATGPRAAHRRIASTDKSARATPSSTATPPTSTTTTTAATTATTTAAGKAQPRLRPAFSTLQQHYSPAKSQAPKPLTSTFLAPPSPSKLPANLAASAETSRLQTELLQLHLLHRDAGAVDAEWQASARAKLGSRFESLVRDSGEAAERERTLREEETVLALRAWGAGGGGLEGKIQGLDAIIAGVWTLTEPGGRYARVVRRFERWLDQVSELQAARHGEGALRRLGEEQPLFVGELETPWKDELPNLLRRLDGWRRQLVDIGEPPDAQGSGDSSLCRVLHGLRDSIDGMLEEVRLMEEMEQDALASEDAWIEATNREDDDTDTQQAGAIWRIV